MSIAVRKCTLMAKSKCTTDNLHAHAKVVAMQKNGGLFHAIHFSTSDELSFFPPFLKFSAADSFRSASRSCQKVDTCPALSIGLIAVLSG